MRWPFGGLREVSGMTASKALSSLVLACILPLLVAGCGHGGGIAASTSAPSASSAPTADSSSQPPANMELLVTLPNLRGGLREAYARGREGKPFQATPSTITALRRYFKTVDPATFNGASRVVFVWAYPIPREPDGHRSTDVKQYVVAYFWADGENMAAAGSMAAGLNAEFFSLSRPSADVKWHVDGLYKP